jgi:hypothetical protein
MQNISIIFALFLLTACGAAAPQATATLPSTVTPSFTATPTFTPTPTLTSDQQRTLDAANAMLAGVWIIDNGGAVTDINGSAPEGIAYSVERGLLTYTYMYEGKEITVDLIQNITTHPIEGCIARFDAKCLTSEGKIAVVTYSSAGGYGYEGDGNPDHKNSVRLSSVAEQQLTLINPDVVDLTYRGFPRYDVQLDDDGRVLIENHEGEVVFKEFSSGTYWGDNVIHFPDGNGGFTDVESTSFAIESIMNDPYASTADMAITYYVSKDGTVKMMLSDIPFGITWEDEDTHLPFDVVLRRWSEWYNYEEGRREEF